jgi:hypothetical protein
MSLLPCLLRKKYFTIVLCSIRSIQIFRAHLSRYLKCRSTRPQCQTLWTDFLAEHIWLIQKLIWF